MSDVRVTVVVPVRFGTLAVGGLEAIAEGVDVVSSVKSCQVVLVGSGVADAADVLRVGGLPAVALTLCESATFQPGRWAEALAELIDDDLVLLPGSNDGRDLAPRLAAALRHRLVTGALQLSAERVDVAAAGGAALVTVDITEPTVVTLQPGVRTVSRVTGGRRSRSGSVSTVPAFAAFAEGRDAEVLDQLPPDVATMDLAEAPFILGGGAGLGTSESFAALREVAGGLGASVGATRVVTDAGWATHDRQIGTTGVVVAPTVYVAFGISGAVQHTSGLGAPAHIISVNTDPHCPMASLADLAVVADAPAVVAALVERLAVSRDGQGADHG